MGPPTPASAVEWAASVEPGTPVRWKALELVAWRRHRTVLAAIEPGRHRGVGFWLFTAATLFAFVAPVVGFSLLHGGRFGLSDLDPAEVIPEAGVCFLVGDLVLVPLAVWALARRSEARGTRGLGLSALILGLSSAILAYVSGQNAGTDPLWLWLTPIVVATAAGLVLTIVGGGSSRPRGRTARLAAQDHAAASRRAAIRSAVAGVPQTQREAVEQELRRAALDLYDRGVIQQAEAERALRAPLGGLSHHMAQRGS